MGMLWCEIEDELLSLKNVLQRMIAYIVLAIKKNSTLFLR